MFERVSEHREMVEKETQKKEWRQWRRPWKEWKGR